jgi:hypothetical protein
VRRMCLVGAILASCSVGVWILSYLICVQASIRYPGNRGAFVEIVEGHIDIRMTGHPATDCPALTLHYWRINKSRPRFNGGLFETEGQALVFGFEERDVVFGCAEYGIGRVWIGSRRSGAPLCWWVRTPIWTYALLSFLIPVVTGTIRREPATKRKWG